MPKASKNKKHILRNSLLIILAILIFAAGIAAYVFRDYLRQLSSFYKGFTHSSEEISSMKEENDKKTNELLNELVEGTMRDLTDEERKLLASGELSASEAISLIQGLMPPSISTGDAVTDTPDASDTADTTVQFETSQADGADNVTVPSGDTQATAPNAHTQSTTKVTTVGKDEPLTPESEAAYKNRISEIIAEIYLLRATYLNKIDDLIASSKLEYLKLPKEQRGLKGKIQVVDRYLRPKGNELEAECDAKMDALLSEMKQILLKLNMSTGIIDEIKYTYKEQKELKMAELYGEYSPSLK